MSKPIPDSALAQHIAVLGKAGSGKSYAMRGIVESLLDENARICIIDPTGVWYGLRTLADGKRAGYKVAIFGGSHADFPLQQHHGEELAEILGTSNTPAILDTSQMRTGERTRLFTDFAEGLLRKNRGPLHLIIDEAHLFAPQGRVNDPQSGAMLHAANNLVSLGRVRGLRVALITQRPAKLHKDSLSQVETLIAMRLIAPQDRKAIEEWIKDNADGDQGRAVLSSLATLKTGTGWVWAPELGILERNQFPKIKTLDSGAAPDGSEVEGKVQASIDRDVIAGRLKLVVQEAEANDPKKLRAQIADLQRSLAAKPGERQHSVAEMDAANNRGFAAGYAEGQGEGFFRGHTAGWNDHAAALRSVSDDLSYQPPKPAAVGGHARSMRSPDDRSPAAAARPAKTGADSSSSSAPRRVLIALAQNPDGVRPRKLGILSEIQEGGSTWRRVFASFRRDKYVDESAGLIRITAAGLAELGDYEPLPTGEELRDQWRKKIKGGPACLAIFDAAIEAFPKSVAATVAAERAGLELGGSTWRRHMAHLRGLELVSGSAELRASEDLFE